MKPDSPAAPVLRVALLAHSAPEEPRDPLAYAVELGGALQEAGVQVHLLADRWVGDAPPSLPFHKVTAPVAEAGGVVASARAYCASLVEVLGRVSRDTSPFHVVHACSWMTAPAALSGRRHGGARAVVTFLDTVFSRYGQVNGDRATAQIRNLEQQAVREADLLIAGTDAVRQELAWLYGASSAQVRVAPCDPLPAADARPAPESLPRRAGAVIGFGGCWSKAGGSDLFLDAVRQLSAGQPGLRMVIAADPANPTRVEADVRRRGLGDLLLVPAGAGDPLAACDLVVVPARTSVGQRGIYRARAAGVLVVVTRTGPAELVRAGRDGALAFPFAASLVEQIKIMLAHPLACTPDDSFTWPKVTINLTAYYRELLAPRGEHFENVNDVARAR